VAAAQKWFASNKPWAMTAGQIDRWMNKMIPRKMPDQTGGDGGKSAHRQMSTAKRNPD